MSKNILQFCPKSACKKQEFIINFVNQYEMDINFKYTAGMK